MKRVVLLELQNADLVLLGYDLQMVLFELILDKLTLVDEVLTDETLLGVENSLGGSFLSSAYESVDLHLF